MYSSGSTNAQGKNNFRQTDMQEAGQTDTLDRRKYNVNMIILFNKKKFSF